MPKILVWDWPVRVFHWAIVLLTSLLWGGMFCWISLDARFGESAQRLVELTNFITQRKF